MCIPEALNAVIFADVLASFGSCRLLNPGYSSKSVCAFCHFHVSMPA